MTRTKPCDRAERDGRLQKAKAFYEAARIVDALNDGDPDLVDAVITLCIHAGIAASDVICCERLGEHAIGDNHVAAVELLRKASGDLANDLRSLLSAKTRSGYSAQPSSTSDQKRALRAAARLVGYAAEI